MTTNILAIDPGTHKSAWVVLRTPELKPLAFGHEANDKVLERLRVRDYAGAADPDHMAIEMPASYGMAVGQEVFDTCFWAGRFWEQFHGYKKLRIFRKTDVAMHMCHSMRAKDGNIRQALIDRFGIVGTKANPGWFYGVSNDVWQAIAVGVTAWDRHFDPKSDAVYGKERNEKVEAKRKV